MRVNRRYRLTGALGAASLPLSAARTENTTHQQGAIVTHID
jgi:hypothetical protein